MKSSAQERKRSVERGGSGRVILMAGLCLLLFVAGLFLAGRQHFSSMDYGMKNSKLRKQIEDLESEKRRLILAREISLSPSEIKKSAKKVGMIDPATDGRAPQIAVVSRSGEQARALEKGNPLVLKTASVRSQTTAVPAVAKASAKTDRPRIIESVDRMPTSSKRSSAAE